MSWRQLCGRVLALGLCLSVLWPLAAQAQSLNALQKIQYTHGIAEEAKKQLDAGKSRVPGCCFLG